MIREGEKRVAGITEVAELAGVSTATVARALSGNGHVSAATRERVHRASEELGYVVSSNASSLATGRTKNVGVVTPFLNRWFCGSLSRGQGKHCSATAPTSRSTTSAAEATSGAACSSTSY